MFNSVGALLVAAFGQAHLSGIAETVLERRFKGEIEEQ
jgi:hypothetical protein